MLIFFVIYLYLKFKTILGGQNHISHNKKQIFCGRLRFFMLLLRAPYHINIT